MKAEGEGMIRIIVRVREQAVEGLVLNKRGDLPISMAAHPPKR